MNSPGKKKILLLRQQSQNIKHMECSYALAVVSSILEPLADVKVIDNHGKYKTHSNKEILQDIKTNLPDIIGFNVFIFNAYRTYELIKQIKENFPNIPILAGGVHSNHCYREIASKGAIVIRGEADIILPKLIKRLEATYFQNNKIFDRSVYEELSKIKGLCFNNHKNEIINTGTGDIVENLDEIPFASFKNFNLNDFIRKPSDHVKTTNNLLTQRGCPYTCFFCKSEDFVGKIREATPLYMLKYIEYLHNCYSYDHFFFMDDNFTISKKRVLRFCELFIESGLNKKISLECQTSICCPLDQEMISIMKEANFLRIQFGIDRLTDYAIIKAKIRPNNKPLLPKLELLRKNKMKTMFSVCLGMDFDNEKTIQDEFEVLKKVKDLAQVISVNLIVPIPGTELYSKHPELHGWYLKESFFNCNIYYYELALGVCWSKGYELNFFQMPRKAINRAMKMQLYMLKHNCLNIFGKMGLAVYYFEKTMILTSYAISKKSPKTEKVVFGTFIKLREFMTKLAYNLFYYKKK